MQKFIKRPIVVEAVQFDGKTFPDGVEPIYYNPAGAREIVNQEDILYGQMRLDVDYIAEIMTLEGPLRCSVGDWIITGIHGEKYPCKPDIFNETYQKIPDNYLSHKLSLEERYQELIYAVETKYPNETRHQTALRYIKEKEHQQINTSATKAKEAIENTKRIMEDYKLNTIYYDD